MVLIITISSPLDGWARWRYNDDMIALTGSCSGRDTVTVSDGWLAKLNELIDIKNKLFFYIIGIFRKNVITSFSHSPSTGGGCRRRRWRPPQTSLMGITSPSFLLLLLEKKTSLYYFAYHPRRQEAEEPIHRWTAAAVAPFTPSLSCRWIDWYLCPRLDDKVSL